MIGPFERPTRTGRPPNNTPSKPIAASAPLRSAYSINPNFVPIHKNIQYYRNTSICF